MENVIETHQTVELDRGFWDLPANLHASRPRIRQEPLYDTNNSVSAYIDDPRRIGDCVIYDCFSKVTSNRTQFNSLT